MSRKKSKDFCNCINDGSKPTVSIIQVKPANHSKVLYSKDMVSRVREKATEVVRCVLCRWETFQNTQMKKHTNPKRKKRIKLENYGNKLPVKKQNKRVIENKQTI